MVRGEKALTGPRTSRPKIDQRLHRLDEIRLNDLPIIIYPDDDIDSTWSEEVWICKPKRLYVRQQKVWPVESRQSRSENFENVRLDGYPGVDVSGP